jgi:hypothetical protein
LHDTVIECQAATTGKALGAQEIKVQHGLAL